MSEDKKKWLGLGKHSPCTCLEFHTDLNQLCDTCPLKKIIPKGIQTQIVTIAEDNRELMPPEQFEEWVKKELESAAKVRGEMRRNAMDAEEYLLKGRTRYYPNVLTELFIWNKERAKALRAVLDKAPPLEEQAAQLIRQAEDKAARFFEDWKNMKRHTIAENDPEVLANLRRRYIEHHERTFIPYLDFEGQTHAQLISRLKFILGEVKAGRDKRPATHYTNRLARRMANAQIITYLSGLVNSQEGRKAEPLPKPTKQKTDSLTTWQRCMYYRYLLEGGAPTPFDNDRKKEEAYNELAERHGGSAAHWKNTWVDTTKLRRKHESKRKKEGLKKVLKLLEEYKDAYRLCEMELRNAGIL